jgi:hypothetical protein
MRKERERETSNICRCLFCCHRERSNQTNTNHVLYVAVRIDVSSVTLCVFFSSFVLATSVRLLYCCYDDDAIYTHSLSHFFFRFSRRCRRRLTTHIHNTLFSFTSTSSFSFSLFFFLACYLKEETQFKIASHSSL